VGFRDGKLADGWEKRSQGLQRNRGKGFLGGAFFNGAWEVFDIHDCLYFNFNSHQKLFMINKLKTIALAGALYTGCADGGYSDLDQTSPFRPDQITDAGIQDVLNDIASETKNSVEAGMEDVSIDSGIPVSSCIENPKVDQFCDKLLVQLAGQTPLSGSIPQNAGAVIFTCWDFKSSTNAQVNSFQLHRFGPGSMSSSVYLFHGNQRISGPQEIDNNQAVEFSQLNLFIPSLMNKKICVVANAEDATGVNGFELSSAEAIVTNSCSIEGNFPSIGASQLVVSSLVGNVEIIKHGSLAEVTAGEKDARIAQFALKAGTAEDQLLTRLSLKIESNNAVCELKNFKLRVGGETTVIATAEKMESLNLVTFVIEKPLKIGKGQELNINITTDIPESLKGQSIKTYLEESVDLLSQGLVFGYGQKVDFAEYNGADKDGISGTDDDKYSYVFVK